MHSRTFWYFRMRFQMYSLTLCIKWCHAPNSLGAKRCFQTIYYSICNANESMINFQMEYKLSELTLALFFMVVKWDWFVGWNFCSAWIISILTAVNRRHFACTLIYIRTFMYFARLSSSWHWRHAHMLRSSRWTQRHQRHLPFLPRRQRWVFFLWCFICFGYRYRSKIDCAFHPCRGMW